MPTRPQIILEIAAASVDDGLAAANAGADRIELSAALVLGGLTPSLGTLIELRRAITQPIIALARPRPGGFCYGDRDLAVIERDIDLMLEHGADGVAVGVLDADGQIDVKRCAALRKRIGAGRQAVFHRAFDFTPDPRRALEQIIDAGFTRIMTSGQQATALEGAALIGDVIHRAAGRIEVIAAGGIRPDNVGDLLLMSGVRQVHASLRTQHDHDRSLAHRPHIPFCGTLSPEPRRYPATNPAAVTEMRSRISGF